MKIIKETLADDAKAYLKGYIRSADDTSAHENYPAVIVVPGGSYTHIPEQQAETLALAFANLGYQSFYLRYQFIGEKTPLLPAPVVDLARAVALIRNHAEEWHIDPTTIVLAGFSVGGHIVSLYSDYWQTDQLRTQAGSTGTDLQPQAVILGYPVISPLLGFPTDEATLATWTAAPETVAADQHVSEQNPPTFIWVTADDPLVPAKNSLAYAAALAEHQVPYELHVFHHGPHGMALANHLTAWKRDADQPHVAHWLTLANEWLNDTLSQSDQGSAIRNDQGSRQIDQQSADAASKHA